MCVYIYIYIYTHTHLHNNNLTNITANARYRLFPPCCCRALDKLRPCQTSRVLPVEVRCYMSVSKCLARST